MVTCAGSCQRNKWETRWSNDVALLDDREMHEKPGSIEVSNEQSIVVEQTNRRYNDYARRCAVDAGSIC